MPDVRRSIIDHCGIVTLDNPESLNAWNADMQMAVADAVRAFDKDPAVSAIVITGQGDRAFCSGQDLNELSAFTTEEVEGWLDRFREVYYSILGASKPVVAALNGVAAGSGYQLALVCDLRVAHPGVQLGQPEVRSGIPSVTGMYLTWQSLGHAKAAELMLTGRLLAAEEAERLGLLTEVSPADQVLARAIQLGAELAGQPRHAFRLTKARLHAMLKPGLDDAFKAALAIDTEAYGAGEPQQTAQQFLTHRATAEQVAAE